MNIAFSNDEQAVSFYCIISQKAVYKGNEFYIGQSCDSMTHKSFGGRGLFINLAELAYKRIQEMGVKFVFGFPNETIYGLRVKKLKWRHTENINQYIQNVTTFPFVKVIKKLPVLNGIYFFYVKLILRKYISDVRCFANSVIDNKTAGILHDEAYFEYKAGKGKYIIKIEGVNFWVKFDGLLWIGDFEPTSQEIFSKAMRTLKHIAMLTGCTSIRFNYQEGTNNDLLLKKTLKVKSTMPYGFVCFSEEMENISFKFSSADFDTW